MSGIASSAGFEGHLPEWRLIDMSRVLQRPNVLGGLAPRKNCLDVRIRTNAKMHGVFAGIS